MKFLCLHGMGTNSQIYEAQLAPIRQHLDPSYEFVFIDGLFPCPPPAGVSSLFEGPFCCYYDKPTAENIQAAYDLVHEVVEEEGPFHGVLGFSQGGALAASLLLYHRRNRPHEPETFKLAVFTMASLPFDLDTDTDAQKHKYNTIIDATTGAVEVHDWAPGVDKVEPSEINGFVVPVEEGDVVLRRYHPARESARIGIPTVHVMGRNDPFLPQGQALTDLCGEEGKRIITHDQGHMLPRDAPFAKKVASAIQQAIHLSLLQH